MKKRKSFKPTSSSKEYAWIYGVHAVERALHNPKRHCLKLVTTTACPWDEVTLTSIRQMHPELEWAQEDRAFFIDLFGPNATHQGVALQVKQLPELSLEELVDASRPQTFVILDQVTDPQNVGAVLRSCAAFGVDALILPDMNTCPIDSPVLAKNASGALEVVPIIRITNLARTLDFLKKEGFWCVGLDETGDPMTSTTPLQGNSAIILGAEGKGMRRLTRECCDFLIRLPTSEEFATLNVSNAAAIVLYEVRRQNLLCSVSSK